MADVLAPMRDLDLARSQDSNRGLFLVAYTATNVVVFGEGGSPAGWEVRNVYFLDTYLLSTVSLHFL